MRRSRRRIREIAVREFHRRGFDEVSVAEIAGLAGVTERTVFRYFPTKADLVFAPTDDGGWDALFDALHARPTDEGVIDSILATFATFSPSSANSELERRQSEIVVATPLLKRRWFDSLDRLRPRLAAWIGERTGRDPDSFEVAAVVHLLLAAHRFAIEHWLATVAHQPPSDRDVTDFETIERNVLHLLGDGINATLAPPATP